MIPTQKKLQTLQLIYLVFVQTAPTWHFGARRKFPTELLYNLLYAEGMGDSSPQ